MKYTEVEHNTFDFTVECHADPSYPGNYFLYDYFVTAANTPNDLLPNNLFGIEIDKISNPFPGRWEVKFVLIVHDYGVGQVGSHLLNAYIKNVFEPIYAGETKFVINDCEFYHPSGKGAKIDWDEEHNKPIIEGLSKETDL